MERSTIFLLSLLISFVTSCTKDLNIDIQPHNSKITINSYFNSAHPIKAHISRSASSITNDYLYNDSAVVVLKENGKVIDTMSHSKNGLYLSNTTPTEKNLYTIEVKTNSYYDCYASDICPLKVDILETRFYQKTLINDDGDDLSEIEVDFIDPPGVQFYEISTNNYNTLQSNNNAILAEGDMDYYPRFLLFKDEKLSTTNTIRFSLHHSNSGTDEITLIYFRSVTEEYYTYRKTFLRHEDNQWQDIWEPANPVEAYSNVENGYGIFAGYQEVVDTVWKNE